LIDGNRIGNAGRRVLLVSGGRLSAAQGCDQGAFGVCRGTGSAPDLSAGHAEVVQIEYDPGEIDFADLLGVFFTIHDPTTLNRQGVDTGTQYRSAIFYHSPAQKSQAETAIVELDAADLWGAPIVTQVVPLTEFFPADASHEDYYLRNPRQPYCVGVVAPKVAKVRKHFFERLKVP
jgi:peptide-methionine (S)-S-oxide reductase